MGSTPISSAFLSLRELVIELRERLESRYRSVNIIGTIRKRDVLRNQFGGLTTD